MMVIGKWGREATGGNTGFFLDGQMHQRGTARSVPFGGEVIPSTGPGLSFPYVVNVCLSVLDVIRYML
jgi:hypothetical protein